VNALSDPVVVKELGGMSRRGRTYFGRIFYVAIAGILVYSVAAPAFSGGFAPSTSQYAVLGRRLFHSFAWLQMLFLPLAAAVGAADVVSREARVGTLQMLFLTPLTGPRIVLGKWKAVMLETLTLALSGAPAMAISVYLGGVGVEDVAWCFSLSMVLSAISAAMAIHYSLRDRTVVEAAFRAYLVLQFSAIPYAIIYSIGAGMRRGNEFLITDAMAFAHPYCAWFAGANPAESGPAGRFGWIGATAVSAYVAWRYLLAAWGHLSGQRKMLKFLEESVPGKTVRKPDDILCSRPPGPVWDEWPLLWKEFSLRMVRLSTPARTVLFVLYSLLTLTCLFNRAESALAQVFVLCPLALIFAVAVGSGHFARENERRGFEMLLSTPLSPFEVVAAKLLAGLMGLEVVMVSGFIAIGFAILILGLGVSFASLLMVAVFILFSYVLASAISLRSRSYRTAFVTTAGIVLFLLIGIPVLMNLLSGSPVGDLEALQFASYALHPFRVYMARDPVPLQDWVVPVNLVFYTGATLLLAGHMVASFRSVAQER
jgi:ABC-type transport system involved in multi-copper enzyme maturation permease subunit